MVSKNKIVKFAYFFSNFLIKNKNGHFKNVQFEKNCQTIYLKNVTIKIFLYIYNFFLNLYALKHTFLKLW